MRRWWDSSAGFRRRIILRGRRSDPHDERRPKAVSNHEAPALWETRVSSFETPRLRASALFGAAPQDEELGMRD